MRNAALKKVSPACSLLVVVALCLTCLTAVHGTARAAAAGNGSSTSGAASTQKDWNMFSFNHSRYDPYEHILTPQNVSRLTGDWTVNLTGFAECSSPAVANGIVYISPVGQTITPVYALNAKTGATIWSVSLNNLITCSSPAVVNGVVYLSSGEVDALNAQTGATIWSNNTLNTVTSPVVANGLVYVGAQDNNVYALDAKTGKVRWSAMLGGSINTISATVANGVLYIGAYDNNLYALNALTGAKLWVAPTGSFVYATPAVDGGEVFIVAGDSDLEAFNAKTGKHLWTATTGVEGAGLSPAAAHGVVYSIFEQQTFGWLRAYTETTGKMLWQSALTDAEYAPAIANGVVYVTLYGEAGLSALDAKTGKELWAFYSGTQGQGESSPTVDNGMLYVGTSYGNLDAFHLPGK